MDKPHSPTIPDKRAIQAGQVEFASQEAIEAVVRHFPTMHTPGERKEDDVEALHTLLTKAENILHSAEKRTPCTCGSVGCSYNPNMPTEDDIVWARATMEAIDVTVAAVTACILKGGTK